MTALDILQKYWGYNQFRPFQHEIIQSVFTGNDTLALLPTGGGKSICFQVPALMSEGVCIVVSPLVSLIQDQILQLQNRNINAVGVYSGMSKTKIDIVLDNCIYGDVKFLYVSPERLNSTLFCARAAQMKVSFLVIDEAHCISKWGYDFRPSYQQIAEFNLNVLNKKPIIALTASAGEKVLQDIVYFLAMKRPKLFKQSFARENLSYSVYLEQNKESKILQILQNVAGSSIVYVGSRNKTKIIADWLCRNGVSATFYHAGLDFKERENNQSAWIHNQKRVMVATNAFGMGIDKPDVRTVIHFDIPQNLEAYYQEAGRAGRDQQKSYAVLLYNSKDLSLLSSSVERKYPSIQLLRTVYNSLANYFQLAIDSQNEQGFEFDIYDFLGKFSLKHSEVHHAIQLLQLQSVLYLTEQAKQGSQLTILVDNLQLYNFQLKNPAFELLIKTILRLYGGEIFTNPSQISETLIAKNTLLPVEDIVKSLNTLHEMALVNYKPYSDKTLLYFTPKRYSSMQLPLRENEIEERKNADMKNIAGMAQYLENTIQCRSILIANYFDEYTEKYCEKCDNCLKRKKNKIPEVSLTDDLFEEKRLLILECLRLEPLQISDLFDRCKPLKQAYFEEIIGFLLRNNTIFYNRDGLLDFG
ncbi:MAG: RecQ family ATP-dependent DNA helicase [Pseudarcicella sp.]|nr:RecQ family ATP-dependent DNA helicase [Pseudarcicella sp.]